MLSGATTPAARAQPPGSPCPARNTLAAAAATPLVKHVGLDDSDGPTRRDRSRVVDHDLQAELIKTAERVQVRASEGSVEYVKVFRLAAPIVGRPRPSPRHRRAERDTLNSEEPFDLLDEPVDPSPRALIAPESMNDSIATHKFSTVLAILVISSMSLRAPRDEYDSRSQVLSRARALLQASDGWPDGVEWIRLLEKW